MILISICSFQWWIPWLISFILGALTSWFWNHSSSKKKMNSLSADLDRNKSEYLSLKNDYDGLTNKYNSLNGEHDLLHNRFSETENNYKILKQEHQTLASETKSYLESDKSISKGSNVDFEKSKLVNKELKNDLDKLSNKYKKLSDEKDALSKELSQSKSDFIKLNKDHKSVTQELSTVKKSNPIPTSSNTIDSKPTVKDTDHGSKTSLSKSNIDQNDKSDTPDQKSTSKTTTVYDSLDSSNLQLIEGIGPKMEELLNENGINNWSELSEQTPATLKSLLNKEGADKYRFIDPTTWANQAQHAAEGRWETLIQYQKDLDTGVDNTLGNTPSKLENYMIKKGLITDPNTKKEKSEIGSKSDSKKKSKSKSKSGGPYSKLKKSDLQIIEGVGPKMEELLNKNGISTWSDLSSHSPEQIRALLDKESPTKYKIIDPTTWSNQATHAKNGEWDTLIQYQKDLDTGRTNTLGNTASKLEKYMIKKGYLKQWKQDDLKAIEGIGPKIEKLFFNAGIKTWNDLATTNTDRLKEILAAAGPKYRLADPGTWAAQAKMAYEGKWDELQEYQDILQGGK